MYKRYCFFMLMILSSCSSWLDVTPKDMIVEDELFDRYLGYRSSLNGMYERMSGTKLYGKETSWGLLDAISNVYLAGTGNIGSENPYYKAMNYNYEDEAVRPFIDGIWSEAYNIIANSNNLINKIEQADTSMFPAGGEEKWLILGETLGIRAFLHFDMLRLYAPAPIVDDGETYLPYYEEFPSYGEKKYTVKEVLDKVIRDLEQARNLVAAFDTLTPDHLNRLSCGVLNARFTTTEFDDHGDAFYAYRGYRMNYPAIVSILARVYNYAGMHDEAFECTQELIELVAPETEEYLFFFTQGNELSDDRKMMKDLIFALSSPDLYTNYEPYSAQSQRSEDACFVLKEYDAMFDDASDYRKVYLTSEIGRDGGQPNRNIAVGGNVDGITSDMIPMIRLSELYYIQAEYYASKSDWSGAASAIDKVRIGRGCTGGIIASKITDAESFESELLKEVKREFITEGQIFFYHKKFNHKFTDLMKQENFVLPLPDAEMIN